MKMVSMKNEEKHQPQEIAPCGDSKYPYGLRICLNQESLEKLGIKELPKVGATMTIQAVVEVCATSQYESVEGGKNKSLDLQITDLGLNTKKSSKEVSKKLYGEG